MKNFLQMITLAHFLRAPADGASDAPAAAPSAAAVPADPPLPVGIAGTLAVVDFLDSLVAAVILSEADGKITITDLMNLKDVIPEVQPMLGSLHNVPDELKNLTGDEIEQLIAEAAKAFPGAQNAQVVLKVKAALAWAKASYDVFLAFKK